MNYCLNTVKQTNQHATSQEEGKKSRREVTMFKVKHETDRARAKKQAKLVHIPYTFVGAKEI